MKRNPRKAMSIVEAVIAMTIIAIVSASAFTIVSAALRISTRATSRFIGISVVEDALECFKYTDNDADFRSALEFNGKLQDTDYTVSENTETNETVYIISLTNCKASLTINWVDLTFNARVYMPSGEGLYVFGLREDDTVVPYTKVGAS